MVGSHAEGREYSHFIDFRFKSLHLSDNGSSFWVLHPTLDACIHAIVAAELCEPNACNGRKLARNFNQLRTSRTLNLAEHLEITLHQQIRVVHSHSVGIFCCNCTKPTTSRYVTVRSLSNCNWLAVSIETKLKRDWGENSLLFSW